MAVQVLCRGRKIFDAEQQALPGTGQKEIGEVDKPETYSEVTGPSQNS